MEGASAPTGGGEGREHIVSPRAQLVELNLVTRVQALGRHAAARARPVRTERSD